MGASIIDGKALAAATKAEAAEKVTALKAQGVNPCLAVILVGENPASQVYVRGKINDCAQCGIESRSINLPAETDRREGRHRRHPAGEGCGRFLAHQRGPHADRRALLSALHPGRLHPHDRVHRHRDRR